ncbi:MAG: hypothetical protein JO235_26130, partial [Chroococcidiopsidaceae cyanobacterium CP_BM_RX_35]|nr:hypothetical protein [Chroococcidiopsidaceae cyanobacterium CP_BM_RX_35]
MHTHITLKRVGDRYIAGIDEPGARESSHETPLQALRRWVHMVGLDIPDTKLTFHGMWKKRHGWRMVYANCPK